ncbi:MAG: GGDEF domain-containing protein [Anaerolineae bacterium]
MNLISYKDIGEIEKDIFLLRWIAIIGGVFLIPIADDVQMNSVLAWVVILVGALYNALVGYLLLRRSYSVYFSYATSITDALLLTIYISAYGSLMNEYAPIYLFSLLAVAMRFGFLETVLMGLADCLLYGAVVLISGRSFSPTSQVLAPCALVLLAATLLGYFAHQVRRWQLGKELKEKRLERKVNELSILQEVSSAVHSLRSGDVLSNIVDVSTRVLGFNRAALFLAKPRSQELEESFFSVRSSGTHRSPLEASLPPFRLTEEMFATALGRTKPFIVAAPQEQRERQEQHHWIIVPLRGAEEPIGVLVVDYDHDEPIEESDLDMLAGLASSAVLAIENSRLHNRVQRMANLDGLTDLFNHRYFQESLRQKLSTARELSQTVSLLMVELDKFKKYNDTYGHQQGDLVLKSVAQALEKGARQWEGMAARYGGDEFVVILPKADKEEAAEAAEQICRWIERMTADQLSKHNLPGVTSSLGVATFPVDADDASSLIDAADQAMYSAKRKGGNRICPFGVPDMVKAGTNTKRG